MSMIFPGMDPYLENPKLWPGVHSRLIVYLADQLELMLRPKYVAAVEERVFVEGPDREVHESYIEILDVESGRNIVTVIEVVSPSNKFPGPGRDSYRTKQREVLGSTTHLVEIDLLRDGRHVLSVPEWSSRRKGPYDYLVCVNRATPSRERFELYPSLLRDRLPRIRIPLAGDDPDVPLNIQAAVAKVYESGSYQARINYKSPCCAAVGDGRSALGERIASG